MKHSLVLAYLKRIINFKVVQPSSECSVEVGLDCLGGVACTEAIIIDDLKAMGIDTRKHFPAG